jgi:serine-type D-Ala-D-Ala carboxypeptidase (penicillin-binding protein 5/6)
MTHKQPARNPARRMSRMLLAGTLAVLAAAALVVSWLGDDAPRSAASSTGAEPSTPAESASAAIGWPVDGVSAAQVGGRLLQGPGARRAVPIASVAKVMTAYVVLRDHPLSAGASGPQIVVTPSEAAAYPAQVRAGESVVRVLPGEVLTEREALEALLLPSADNIAWILARWDAGSLGAFVDRMNAAARGLGMTSTTYTDPSGLASSTTSSAADQVRLGVAAMGQPALAQIVAMSSAVIPVVGPVENLNRLLGVDGIVGLKTGSTSAAGGCVLLAARSAGRLIVAAVFGQPGSPSTILPAALAAGRQLVAGLQGRHGVALSRPRGRRREGAPEGQVPPQSPG